ncbi:MAG: sugar ABC transporter permease [Anaerolineales bacterium]|nr:sugar ABC transporter permease [Anaerolineales bacterium]
MVSWSGRRKALTILLFIAPTMIGILLFNIYPIIYNTYISFTNRNQYKPNPDCTVFLTSILEPGCWPVFEQTTGMGTPFTIQDPLFQNYADLLGKIFTSAGLVAVLRLAILFVPLIIAGQVNKYYEKKVTRRVSSMLVWLLGLAGVVLVGALVDAGGALKVLQDSSTFFVVVFRTILFVIITVPINYVFGLVLALVLNSEHIKGRTFFRAVMIIPWAASTMFIIMSLIWQFFFRDQGTVNQLLRIIGLEGKAWLNDPTYAFAIIILVNLWFSFPFCFNIILGSLQSIPADQYEAAEMDGATYWQQLVNITLPLIRPAIVPAIVLSAIGGGGFQMFGTVWAITAGGPSRGAGAPGATELVMVYAYKQVFQFNAYAKAGAFAVIIFIFLFIATLYSLRITRITKGAYE